MNEQKHNISMEAHDSQNTSYGYAEENPQHNSQFNFNGVEMFEKTDIEGTPFRLIKNENKYFIAFGLHAITAKYETAEEALGTLETDKWIILCTVIGIISEKVYKEFSK